MQIENVTRNHRVGGRMVLLKRETARKGQPGFLLKLEGGAERFVPEGDDIEVTSGGRTHTRTQGRIRSRR
jgi:hypothetical protein